MGKPYSRAITSSCVGDRGPLAERGVVERSEARDVRSYPAPCPLVPLASWRSSARRALLVALGACRADTSDRAFGLVGLALDVSTERGPGSMAMLSRDRALNVSEPQLTGQASERLPEATDRVGLPGARSASSSFAALRWCSTRSTAGRE